VTQVEANAIPAMPAHKVAIRKLAASAPVRLVALTVNRMLWVLGRVWTHLRFKALVPQAGEGSICHWSVEIKAPENLTVGRRVRINPKVILGAASPISLGDDVVIAQGAMIETGGVDPFKPLPYPHLSKPITIERGAWIAAGAIVLGGVTIGEGAVIGAGAVISKDVPPYAMINAAANRMFIRPALGSRRPAPASDPEMNA